MLEIEAITQSSKKCIWKGLVFCISSCPRDSRRGKANPEDVFAAITLPTFIQHLLCHQHLSCRWLPWPRGLGLPAWGWQNNELSQGGDHQQHQYCPEIYQECKISGSTKIRNWEWCPASSVLTNPAGDSFCTFKFKMQWEDQGQVGFGVQDIMRWLWELVQNQQKEIRCHESKPLKLAYMWPQIVTRCTIFI